MKRINCFLITLFLITGCAGGSKQSTDELVVIDVTNSYPRKEFKLQDIMDIEYIPLETAGEFLCPGNFKTIVSDNHIAVADVGSILLFDKTGKGLWNINKRGQGPGEYQMVTDIALDEDNNEMFVLDWTRNQIVVYDLQGKFIRSFNFQDGYRAIGIRNFDRAHLICVGFHSPPGSKPPFFVISKQDGAFKELIEIPRIEQISIMTDPFGSGRPSTLFPLSIIPYRNNWILSDYSSDSLFMFSPDFKKTPVIARTPPIHTMNPQVVLRPTMFTDRYYFMDNTKYVTDGNVVKQFVYDSLEKALFEYTMYNDDYPDMPFTPSKEIITGNEVVSAIKFESFKLVEANREGKLKGGLKEIASKLAEDDNPVLMLVKHKK